MHTTRTSQARASPREPPRAKPHMPPCGSFSFAQTVTFVTASRKAPTMRRIGSSRSPTRRGRCTWDSRATTSTRPKALSRTNRVALQATPLSSRVPTERSSIRRLIRRRCVRRLGLNAQMQHACCSLESARTGWLAVIDFLFVVCPLLRMTSHSVPLCTYLRHHSLRRAR